MKPQNSKRMEGSENHLYKGVSLISKLNPRFGGFSIPWRVNRSGRNQI